MGKKQQITVRYAEDEPLNGLGQMIGQYLEQNLRDFPRKVKQGLRLNISTSVEVDRGISITVEFSRNTIFIKNNICAKADLHLKSNYTYLADVLSGKVSPLIEVIRGNIKLMKAPLTKPLQTLRLLSFLKIPNELILEKN
jgi:hypothetical protein